MLRLRRENGKMLFVLLCVFFLVVFFSRYDIDIWLATVSLAELMKSPGASDWSTRASDWSNKITFSNSNMGLCAKERHGKNLVLTCASKKRDGVKSFPSLEFWVSLSCVLDKDKPRLGSILPRSEIFGSPLAILASHATFSRTKLGSQFVSSFDRSGRSSSQSRDYISNTEILPFIQQRDIADIKLGPTGTLIQLWEKKSSEKIIVHRKSPVCLGFCGTIVMQSRFIAPLHYQFHSRGIILKLSGGRRSIEQNVISSPKKPIPAPPLVCSIFRPFHSPRKNGVSRLVRKCSTRDVLWRGPQ